MQYVARQPILNQAFLLAGPESGEHKNGPANPGLTQLYAFVCARDAETVSASFLQRLRNRYGAQAVGIRLHHRENLRLRADVPADVRQIVGDCLQGNLRPQGTS